MTDKTDETGLDNLETWIFYPEKKCWINDAGQIIRMPIDKIMGKEILFDVKNILDKNKITFCLNSGTLLGAIREKNFLQWKQCIDLCIIGNTLLFPYIKDIFRKNGYEVSDSSGKSYEEIELLKNNILVEITFGEFTDDGFELRCWDKRITLPSRLYDKYTTISFLGKEFNSPNKPEEYLDLFYGPDWRTPKIKHELLVKLVEREETIKKAMEIAENWPETQRIEMLFWENYFINKNNKDDFLWLKKIIDIFGIENENFSEKKLLDIGSAYSGILTQIKFKTGFVLDPLPLKNIDNRITRVYQKAEQSPFNDNEFDAVFIYNVLQHVENVEKCLYHAWRVLKPNYKLYLLEQINISTDDCRLHKLTQKTFDNWLSTISNYSILNKKVIDNKYYLLILEKGEKNVG